MPTLDLPDRPSLWQWLQVALLVANLWWTTLYLGGHPPDTMVVTSALTGLLLIVHFAGLALASPKNATHRWRPSWRRLHPAGWWLLPFVIYATANVLWVTPVPWLGWHDWLMWAQMIAVFWVALNGIRSRAAWEALWAAFFALAVVVVILATYQRFVKPDWFMMDGAHPQQFLGRAAGPLGIPNSLGGFLLLLLPASGVRACERGLDFGRRVLFIAMTLFLAFGLFLTISRGAWLGLGLALVAWPMFRKRRGWIWRMGGAVLVLALLLVMGAVLYSWVPSVRGRLDSLVADMGEKTRPIMWRGAWVIFRDHPAWGGGAGSFNVLFEKYRPESFQDEPQWAHNDYLNTLCDYGVAGFTLFFAVGGVIAWQSSRGGTPAEPKAAARTGIENPNFRQALGIGLLAFALQLFVEFHFKVPALAMAFAVVGAWLVQRGWNVTIADRVQNGLDRLFLGLAASAIAVLVVTFVLPHYRAEAARYDMRRQIDRIAIAPPAADIQRNVFLQSRATFASATRIDPSNAQAWSDRAYATTLWALVEKDRDLELGKEAEAYSRMALKYSKVVPEFWLRLGIALDMQGRWVEGGDAFAQALILAPATSLTWYYQAYHLSLKPSMHAMAESAIAISLRLDPSRRESQVLQQRLAASH
jgi:O-antigen ligase